MKKISLLTAVAVMMAFAFTLQAAPKKSRYDATWNERRIQEITKEILQQVQNQEAEYKRKLEEQGKGQNGGDFAYYGPGMTPPQQKQESLPEYKLDRNKIRAAVTSRFGGKESDSISMNSKVPPRVDVRSRAELWEEARKEIDAKPEYYVDRETIVQQEIKDAIEKYPLYKEGETVEIRFAHGSEPRRTYRGTFRAGAGAYKIWIGRDMLNMDDLPDLLRPRFDARLNQEARQKEVDKHILIQRAELKREEAIAALTKEKQQKQFDQNLPRGWVYVNECWKMPSEMVDEVLEYRKLDLQLRNTPRTPSTNFNVIPGRSN